MPSLHCPIDFFHPDARSRNQRTRLLDSGDTHDLTKQTLHVLFGKIGYTIYFSIIFKRKAIATRFESITDMLHRGYSRCIQELHGRRCGSIIGCTSGNDECDERHADADSLPHTPNSSPVLKLMKLYH